MEPLTDALLTAPAGAALVAALEARERRPPFPHVLPDRSHPDDVGAAVDAVRRLTWYELLQHALDATLLAVGPWIPGAADEAAAALRDAEARRPIAEAIVERFGPVLEAAIDRDAQEWWWSDRPPVEGPALGDLGQVYGNGEFTFGGVWTVTAPPPELHDSLADVWELHPPPIHRWRAPARKDARVWEVHRPADWVRLVERYPAVAAGHHGGWELPGPNQHAADLARLLDVPGQRATRARIGGHLLPDWEAVAAEWDGVHLSWAGFLTTEGYVADVGDAVTMLRYWCSERTLWLRDVFVEPRPLALER